MKWQLLYFDDQAQNIECYELMLADRFGVVGCKDATAYAMALRHNDPQAILLDVHMPELSGHDLYQKIVADPAYNGCPILFVSGDVSDDTKLRSLANGMDFLTRDMGQDEIEGRLTSKIRLYRKTAGRLRFANLVMDYDALKVFLNGKVIDLTLIEMRILANVLRTVPEGITREELLGKVWGTDNVKPGTINTHVTWIKSKLADWDYLLQIKQEVVSIVERT